MSAQDPGQSLAGMVPRQVSDDHRTRLLHAWSCMGQHHWQDALDTLVNGPRLGTGGRLAIRTAANMLAFQQHRPRVYEQLAPLFPIDPPNRHYRPVRSKAGWLTIVVRTIEGDKLINPIDDPEHAAKRDVEKLADTLVKDVPLLLAGSSDGYFLDALVKNHPELPGHKHAAVYLVEPEPDLLLANLALHDWSGPKGPIRLPWVEWFVGTDWAAHFIHDLDRQWMLPVPGLVLGKKELHAPLKQAIARVKALRRQTAIQHREQALSHGVYTSRDQLVNALKNNAGRPARALIVGSRFGEDDPGQPGTSDPGEQAQHAFEELGWHTRRLTETAVHHRLTPLCLWRELGEFKPDLIFSIGERWADRRDAIDPRIPIIRWIDDQHRSKLAQSEKANLYLRDFVLAQHDPLSPVAAIKGYPRRQLLDMPGFVRVATAQVAAGTTVGPDLTYLGDEADDPRDLLFELVERTSRPGMKLLLQLVGEEMLVQYETGKSYPTPHHIAQLTERMVKQVDDIKPSRTLFRQTARALFHPFNDALYRQQALEWAGHVADDMDLKLVIHGRGWANRRRFKRFAKGRLVSQKQHDKATVRSKVNLHIAPGFCLDTKLMDGLAVGGFFLVRQHPANTLLPEFGAFLEANCPPEVGTCAQARKAVDKQHHDQLERLIEQARWIADLGEDMDPVRCIRAALHAGLIDRHHVPLPRLDQTTFDSQAQLKKTLERFLARDNLRLDVVRKQRTTVEHRLCFSSGIARAITRIAELIGQEQD